MQKAVKKLGIIILGLIQSFGKNSHAYEIHQFYPKSEFIGAGEELRRKDPLYMMSGYPWK